MLWGSVAWPLRALTFCLGGPVPPPADAEADAEADAACPTPPAAAPAAAVKFWLGIDAPPW
ncbi:hypothetical protein GW17_00056406, partial [Ensete ventricosum]